MSSHSPVRRSPQIIETMTTITTENAGYGQLLNDIGTMLSDARKQLAVAVNNVLVDTYWHIGKHVVEFEHRGNERAEYGSGLINRLSRDLTERYGWGFSKSNILYMRKF